MKLLSKYFLVFFLVLVAEQALGQSSSIESIDPQEGYAGQLVSIKGVDLAGIDKVFFGAMEGQIINVSDQLIEVKVPPGATYDNVTILNSTTGLTYSSEHFMLSYGGEQGIEASDFDSPQANFPAKSGLYDVSVSDLDGDGKNDIIGANSNANTATILSNISTPNNISFVPKPLNLGAPTLNSTAGDLNGDGKPEVVFSEGNDGNRLIVLVNVSTPTNPSFTLQFIPISSSSTKRVVIKDMDFDGKPDLVVSDQTSNKIYIVKNTSSGGNLSFSGDIVELTVENAQSTAGLDVEDLNGDGKPEIITNQFLTDGGGFYIASNQSSPGNFSFSSFNQFNTGGTLVNLKVGDLNQDGKPDIAATLFLSSSVAVFINETAGTGEAPQFGSAQNLATDLRPWGLDFGDIDGDGNIDIIVSTIGADKTVNVLNNDGGGGLSFSKVSVPVEFINRNVKVADFDGDSKPDIVFSSVDDESNGIPASKISILRNNRCITPVITPEGPINVCDGNTVTLEAQDLNGVTFEWMQDGTVVKSGADNFIELSDAAASGSYTVAILSEGGSCNEISEAVEVAITSAGSATTGSPVLTSEIQCSTLTLSSDDVGATAYEWRGPQDFTAAGIEVTVTNFNVNKAGRYYLDVYAGSCIVETKSIVVDAEASPDFSIAQTGAGTYCEGETVSLSISPISADFGFQWYNGADAITDATSATFNPTSSGDFYVEISDQINTSCPKIYSDTLSVAFLAEPQVDFTLPSTACISTPVAFANESVVADGSTAQFSWDFGDGGTSSAQDPTHVYNSAGTFDVVLEISYDGFSSCTSQSTKQIVVNGGLNVEISPSASAICEGDSVTLSVDGTFASYQWDTGETSPTITVNEGGTYSVTVADENGCEGVSEILIQEFPEPDVTLTASSMAIVQGDTVSISASGLTDFQWIADSTQLSFTEGEIEITLSTTTTIKVEGQDENGCFGSAEITIQVDEESNIGDRLTPMKFFSPNNDAIAQFWEIENIENFSQCGVEIYDQQGNKIYESKPYNNDWEGTANGSPIPDGVYYYVIKCEGTGIAKSGSITLLR